MGGPPQAQLVAAPKTFTVTARQTGQVFSLALDDADPPNIYAAATSAYGLPIVVPDAEATECRIARCSDGRCVCRDGAAVRERHVLHARGCYRQPMRLPGRHASDRGRQSASPRPVLAAALRRPQLSDTAAVAPVPMAGRATPMEIARRPQTCTGGKVFDDRTCRCDSRQGRERERPVRAFVNACCRRRPKRKRRRRRDPRRIRRRSRRRVSVSGSASALAAAVRAVEGLPVAEGRQAAKVVESRWRPADI